MGIWVQWHVGCLQICIQTDNDDGDEEIFLQKIFLQKVFLPKIFSQKIFSQKIFSQKIFSQKIFPQKIFLQKIFSQNIFERKYFHKMFANNIHNFHNSLRSGGNILSNIYCLKVSNNIG